MIKKILILELDKSVSEHIKWTLFHDGYQFVEGGTEVDIQAALQNQTFGLILADIGLIRHQGIPLAQWVSESSQNQHTPVLFLVGINQLQQHEQWLLINRYDYVLKPIRQQDLLFRVSRHLKKNPTKVVVLSPEQLAKPLMAGLAEEGFWVVQVSQKPEALKVLELNQPEVVVLDTAMCYSFNQDILDYIQTMVVKPFTVMCMSPEEWSIQYPLKTDETLMSPILPADLVLRIKLGLNQSERKDRFKPFPGSTLQSSETVLAQSEKEQFLQQIQVALHHEIRNPLTSILIGSQALTHQFKEGSPEKEVLSGIEKCSRRIKDVMDSLGNLKHFVVEDYVDGVKMINFSKSAMPLEAQDTPAPVHR